MLWSNLIDLLGVSDDFFKDALFSVEGFKLYRKDNRSSSGGILVLIRDDIIHVRRKYLENIVSSGSGEVPILECKLRSDKWIIANVYRNPKLLIQNYITSCKELVEALLTETNNIVLIGDFNINLLKHVLMLLNLLWMLMI